MMKILVGFLFFVIVSISSLCSFCQSNEKNNRKTFSTIAEHYIPSTTNGLRKSAYKISASIRIDRNEKDANIILNIRSVPSTPIAPEPSFTYMYNYRGQQYGDQHIGREVFNQLRISNVWYKIKVGVGSQMIIKEKVDGRDNFIGPVARNTSAADVHVWIEIASAWLTNSAIENAIREYIESGKKGSQPSTPPIVNRPMPKVDAPPTLSVDKIISMQPVSSPAQEEREVSRYAEIRTTTPGIMPAYADVRALQGKWQCTKKGAEIIIKISDRNAKIISVANTSLTYKIVGGILYEDIRMKDRNSWSGTRNSWIYNGIGGVNQENGRWEKGNKLTFTLSEDKNTLIASGHWTFKRIL